jgi:hypothetical protein
MQAELLSPVPPDLYTIIPNKSPAEEAGHAMKVNYERRIQPL